MIKPLFLGVAVFLFVQKGAKKGQTIYKVVQKSNNSCIIALLL